MSTDEHSPSFEPGVFLPGGPTAEPTPTPATSGYKLTHFNLRIRSPARSLHFYVDLLGMRTVFTMNNGPFTMYYLGYPPEDATREAELRAWAEQTSNPRVLTQTLGLLELFHVHGSEAQAETSNLEGPDQGMEISTGNQPPNLGFGHLGFSVPDVPAAVERLRAAGVKIFKELDDVSRESVPLSEWESDRGIGRGEIHTAYRRFMRQIAYVVDPVSSAHPGFSVVN